MPQRPNRLMFIIVFSMLFSTKPVAGELTIYFIDVEQADSTLVIAPSGQSLLIDSGKNGMGGRIRRTMLEAGISEIDHYVTTHYHEDHFGGIDDLINEGVTVHRTYDRGDKAFLPPSKLAQQTYLDYESTAGRRATHLMRGETIDFAENILVTVISSGGVVLGEDTPPQHADEENDMSISLLINYQGFQLFVGGDIEYPTERKIAELDLVRNIDIYQANHHGSHSSSSVDFMEDLAPSIVVVSNGSTKTYQHPRKVTLETFMQLPSPPLVLQTNKYTSEGLKFGNVLDDFIADIPPNDEKGTIKAVADSGTKEITITYRTKSHTIPFKDFSGISSVQLIIEKLLPDPDGSDYHNESVTLKNKGVSTVSLNDYLLMDDSGRIWIMDGPLEPGQSIEIKRQGMPMSLNNDGDTIQLTTLSGHLVDEYTYNQASQNQEIVTGH